MTKRQKKDVTGFMQSKENFSRPEVSFSLKKEACALMVIKALENHGFAARFAGGCVRDRQLNICPKDYDVATNALPAKVSQIFASKAFKVIPTGIEHGTVTVLKEGISTEVTTLRKDVATDGRHATVVFGHSFEEDALRRDFTINAMYEDAKGCVYDFYDGIKDIELRRLRFVGKAEQRIKEDYLRIMRLFRFWARFGFSPDANTLQAVASNYQGLSRVSQERISSELLEMLRYDLSEDLLEALWKTKVIWMVFPELDRQDDNLSRAENREKLSETLSSLRRHLGGINRSNDDLSLANLAAILLSQDSTYVREHAKQIARRLRLSNKQTRLLCLFLRSKDQGLAALPSATMNKGELMEYLDLWEKGQPSDFCFSLLLPAWRILYPEHQNIIDHLRNLESHSGSKRQQGMPISGKDLIKHGGQSPGPELQQLLLALKRSFRNGEWESFEQGLALSMDEKFKENAAKCKTIKRS